MRRVSRITVAGAATASLALALSACGGTSTDSLVLRRLQGRPGPRHRVRRRRQGRPVLQRRGLRGPGEGRRRSSATRRTTSSPPRARPTPTRSSVWTSLAKQGYNPVIGVGFAYAPAVKEAAAKYPNTTFGIVDDSTVEAEERRGPGLLRGAGLLPRRCRRGQVHQDGHGRLRRRRRHPADPQVRRRASSRASRTPTRRSRSSSST